MALNHPLVSIIVPNFNHERFLPQRLESIAAQSYRRVEVLLLDDASSDNSIKILEKFAAPLRARLLINDRNSGSPFFQWNKGAAQAQGELLWFAESDDYADPLFLERVVEYFTVHENLGLAYCRSWRVSEEGERIELLPRDSDSPVKDRFVNSFIAGGVEAIRSDLFYHSTIPNASSVVVRKQAFLEAGGAPTHMKLCGDWLIWLKILGKWDLAYHAEALNYFRVPHAQSQRRAYQHDLQRMREWLEVVGFLRVQGLLQKEQLIRAQEYLAQMNIEAVYSKLRKLRILSAASCCIEAMKFDPWCLLRGCALGLRKMVGK